MSRLNHTDKYFGTYVKGKDEKRAYIQWDTAKEGFLLRDAETNIILSRNVFETVAKIKAAGVKFKLDRRAAPTPVHTPPVAAPAMDKPLTPVG